MWRGSQAWPTKAYAFGYARLKIKKMGDLVS